MAIKFHCTSCEAEFELEIPRLIEKPTSLKCSGCDVKPPAHRTQALGTSLEDLLSAMAALRSQFRFEIKLETDALPPPYGPMEDDGALGGADDDDLVEGVEDEDEEDDAEKDDDDDDSDDDEEEDEEEEAEEEGGFDFGDDDDDDDDEDDEDDEEEEEDDE